MRRRFMTGPFWLDTGERMVRAGASSALAVIGADQIGILAVEWGAVAQLSGLAAVVSLLTSVVAGTTGDPATAGFSTNTR